MNKIQGYCQAGKEATPNGQPSQTALLLDCIQIQVWLWGTLRLFPCHSDKWKLWKHQVARFHHTRMAIPIWIQDFEDWGFKANPPKGYKNLGASGIWCLAWWLTQGMPSCWWASDRHHIGKCLLGVVNLWGLQLVPFLAELNHLETWATDIGHAYLEAKQERKST